MRLPLARVASAVVALQFPERERPVAERLVSEIRARADVLVSLGLGYLTLDRATTTLSGGEAHRVRLATQIGARMHLSGATVKGYVSALLLKLGCDNRTQAGLLAFAAGLARP